MNNLRQRGEETPSHGGGLTAAARQKLEEYRRSRDNQRGAFLAHVSIVFVHFISQRVSPRSKNIEMMVHVASGIFNGDLTATANGEVDAATVGGSQLHARSVAEAMMLRVFVSRMPHGTQRRVVKQAMAVVGVLRVIGVGMRRHHVLREVVVQMTKRARWRSMQESGRRSRFGWTGIGTWVPRKARSQETRSTIHSQCMMIWNLRNRLNLRRSRW